MENRWKTIWNQRSADLEKLHGKDKKKVFLELKRSNGFDVVGDGLTYEAFWGQYLQAKNELSFKSNSPNGDCMYIKSVYEVGCGSGANLYLFENDNIRGGGDYSKKLIAIAKQVLHTKDLLCDEAIHISTEKKYDALLSNGVFSYFLNEEYAWKVLEKMYQKSRYSIGILDLHDQKKKEAFLEYRKKNVENYEERYKNLPKLFYSKTFFLDFAEQHHMDIKFTISDMEGYWNNDFVFQCYMYKHAAV